MASQPSPDTGSADQPEVCVFTPSPLYTVTIECSAEKEPEVHFHAGGQGFWIARMVNRLGAAATLCAPFGGESGTVLRTLVEAEGVELRASETQGWNGGYVHDRRSGKREPVANVRSPRLNRHELLTGVRRPAGDETGIEWRGAAGGEVGFVLVHTSPRMSWTRGLSSTPDCATGRSPAPEHVS
jgi:hypothetical protein